MRSRQGLWIGGRTFGGCAVGSWRLLICAGTVWSTVRFLGAWLLLGWLPIERRAAGGVMGGAPDARPDRRRLWRPRQQPASGHGPPPGRLGRAAVRAGAPSLIWVLAPGRGDKMIDGVIPGVRGRSVFLGRPRQHVTAGALREPAAAHLLRCGHRTHTDHLRRPRAARQPTAGAAGRRRPAPAPDRPVRPGRGGRGGPACALSTGSRGWQKGGL